MTRQPGTPDASGDAESDVAVETGEPVETEPFFEIGDGIQLPAKRSAGGS